MQESSPKLTKIDNEPAVGEETMELKVTESTPVNIHLKTILIAISDSKHAEYAFNWAMKHFINKDKLLKNIILLTIQSLPSPTTYYSGLSADVKFYDALEKRYLAQCTTLLRYIAASNKTESSEGTLLKNFLKQTLR